jgi:hypothetical protein
MNPFFLILALDEKNVITKIHELQNLGYPYLIICGKDLQYDQVIFRKPKGKYDAINFGLSLVPKEYDVIILNDVDTEIVNFDVALDEFYRKNPALLFASVSVKGGPQRFFYPLIDTIRRLLPIAASGELLFMRRDVLDKLVPIKPCKAEDTYLLFKVLELKENYSFCDQCFVITERTKVSRKEADYKRKTVCGIYQALQYSNAPFPIKSFYAVLPLISPMLLVFGENGYFWMKGILLGLSDYLHGDRLGYWQRTYMDETPINKLQ